MSDSPWQSPSGSNPIAGSGGSTTPPGPPPPPAPPTGGFAPPPGWTPPPRPGLVPLGPMGLGTILGGAFRVLRRNPRPVIGFSLLIHIVVGLISLLITGIFTVGALTSYFNASETDNFNASTFTSLFSAYGVTFLVSLIGVAGDAVLQGIITTEVARATIGEKLPLRALWARARGRLLVLLGWAFAIIIVVLVVLAIYVLAIALLAVLGGTAGAVISVILAIVGFLAALVAAFWLSTKLAMVPSVLVLERLTLWKAMRRSWILTTGMFYFWRTLGIELLVAVIVYFASEVAAIPILIIVGVIFAIANPTGFSTTSGISGFLSSVTQVSSVVTAALVGTITAVITTAVTSLLYIDLRIRKEGLDLTLMRFVDAQAAGGTDLPSDPYLPVVRQSPAPPQAPQPPQADPGA